MELNPFSFASTPHIHFGAGKRTELTGILAGFGHRVLLVTGGQSFDASAMCQTLWNELQSHFAYSQSTCEGRAFTLSG